MLHRDDNRADKIGSRHSRQIVLNHQSEQGWYTTMKIGLFVPLWEAAVAGETLAWDDVLTITQTAEQAGFDSVWLPDHLLISMAETLRNIGAAVSPEIEARAPQGSWDGWMLLAGLAAVTSRIELGTLVTCTSFRNPPLLAKMADTIDEISGGRLILGLGAGDSQYEHRAFGYPLDHLVGRFEEALIIIRTLLREGWIDHRGRYYQARACELRPRGPRQQGPPIMIGTLGAGPRMVRLTAQYADIWNGWLGSTVSDPALIPPIRTIIDEGCLKYGRDPATVKRTAGVQVIVADDGSRHGPIQGSIEEIVATLARFQEHGIDHLQIWLNPTTRDHLEAFLPVLERLKGAS